MLLAILQAMFKFVLNFNVILGVVFMVICTVFVVSGDIKINVVKRNTEKENK